MLDTVKIYLPEDTYSVAEDSTIQVQPASYTAGTKERQSEFLLFKTVAGRNHYGSKAFLNTERFHLDIKPFTFQQNKMVCFVHFSVPKVYTGNNYYSVGEEGTEAVFQLVENELKKHGVYANLNNAYFSRLDTFKNIQPEEPFETYSPLFSLLKAERKLKRSFGTTFMVSNTQQEFMVYDKLQEMKNRKMETAGFPETMRFEHRLLSKDKISSVLGFSQVADLFKGGYAVIKDKRKESWKENMFQYSVEEVVQLGSNQLEKEMRTFRKVHGTHWFHYFLKSYGSFHLATFAGVEVVEKALEKLESNRMKINRARKTLEEAEAELMLYRKEETTNKTYASLYNELKDKVLE
jgi:hypothetical protein